MSPLRDFLYRPVDASSLALFRIVFGLVMAVDMLYMWVNGENFGSADAFRGHYAFLSVMEGWRAPDPNVVFPLIAAAGLVIATGTLTRVAAALFCVVFSYVFVLDPARFNNHEYLIAMLAGLLVFVRSDAVWSVRARRLGAEPTIPFWHLGVFRFLLCVVYFYGGIAKFDADWLRGEPIVAWVDSAGDNHLLGYWFRQRWVGLAIGYIGVVFDLFIWVLLLWRPTRPWAIGLVLVFHLTNSQLFNIGVFPWLGIGSLVLFLDADTPRRLWERLTGAKPADAPTPPPAVPLVRQNLATSALVLFAVVQLVVPFRHWAYSGWVEWNQVGKSFSWRMMLSYKEVFVGMQVVDVDRKLVFEVDQGWRIAEEVGVTPGKPTLVRSQGQLFLVPSRLIPRTGLLRGKGVWGDPRLLAQYARSVAADARALGIRRPFVRVDAVASLNGRPFQYLVDPTVNLAEAEVPLLGTPEWVVPLAPDQPLGDYSENLQEFHDRAMGVIQQSRAESSSAVGGGDS